MKLADQVDVITAASRADAYGNVTTDWANPVTVATIPAYVGARTSTLATQAGRMAFTEQLVCLIGPFDYNPAKHRIRWRGGVYTNDGPPMNRMVNGRPHHLTIPLKVVT